MSESVKHWIALNMVLGVGKTFFHRLFSAFGSPEEVLATLMQLELKGNTSKLGKNVCCQL
jgi:hypothetical protein